MKLVVAVASAFGEKAFESRALSPVLTTSLRFEDLYKEHAPFVWRVLRGMGVPDAVVEDALQDVFVVVHGKLGTFDGRHPVKTWLFAIAYRIACNYRRKYRSTRQEALLDEQLTAPDPTPADTAEHVEALSVLGRLLDGLTDDKRAVLILAEVEGLSAPEIAEVTRTPLNTVYTRLRRARIALSDALSTWRKEDR